MYHAIISSIFVPFNIPLGLVGQNAAVDMALTSAVMSQIGVTDERGTKSVITTCGAGGKRDVVNDMKEIVEDQETVLR